jgi:hypothetical protein
MKKTKAAFEKHLNELYADIYSFSQAHDQFSHFKNGKITEREIYQAYNNHSLGTLLRKCDPVAFNVGFNEWKKD